MLNRDWGSEVLAMGNFVSCAAWIAVLLHCNECNSFLSNLLHLFTLRRIHSKGPLTLSISVPYTDPRSCPGVTPLQISFSDPVCCCILAFQITYWPQKCIKTRTFCTTNPSVNSEHITVLAFAISTNFYVGNNCPMSHSRDGCNQSHWHQTHEDRFCELSPSLSYAECSWTIECGGTVCPWYVPLSAREFNVLTAGNVSG